MFAVKLWKKMRNKRENMIFKTKKDIEIETPLKQKQGRPRSQKMTLWKVMRKKCILFRDEKISIIITL